LSSYDDINRKYRRIVKTIHPDRGGDNARLAEINKAYAILKEYIKNYKFSFTEDEIQRQYPQEFLKKFKV